MDNLSNIERHNVSVALAVASATIVAGVGGLSYWMVRTTPVLWQKALAASIGAVSCLGVASVPIALRERIDRKYNASLDMSDQVEVQQDWIASLSPPENVTKTTVDFGTAKPADMPEMTWKDFVKNYINKPELKPHIGIFGATGTGKTWLAEAIGDLRAEYYIQKGKLPRKIYLSPTCDRSKDEFLGWELIGEGFNLGSITDFSDYLRSTLYERYQETSDSQEPIIVTPDEYRWTAAKAEGVPDTISDVLSIGRKRQLEIILVAPSFLVKTLKMEGEGQLRDSMTMMLKGTLLTERVRALEKDGFFPKGSVQYLTRLMEQYPYNVCLCDDRILILPDMSGYRKEKKSLGITYATEPPILLKFTPNGDGVQKKRGRGR